MQKEEINCKCRKENKTSQLITCNRCKTHQHEDCIKNSKYMKLYECPDCQMRDIDLFIKPIKKLSDTVLIRNANDTSTLKFDFDAEWLKTESKNKKFIIVRCLKLDSNGYSHHWPFNCSIVFNNQKLTEFKLAKGIVFSRQREDFPIIFHLPGDLTNNYHYLNPKFSFPSENLRPLNIISLTNYYNENKSDIDHYAMSVELVEIIADLKEIIESIPVINSYQKLFNCEIIESVAVSFLDCYNGKRIILPARGCNCDHADVFDIFQYLQITRKNKRYTCPICRLRIPRLEVDYLIKDLMANYPENDKILINKDLKVTVLKDTVSLKTSQIINIDSDIVSDQLPALTAKNKPDLDKELINILSVKPYDKENNNSKLKIQKSMEIFFLKKKRKSNKKNNN